MPKVKIGPIDSLVLFGGGFLMIRFAKESIKRGIKTHVFAVRRHLDEIIDEERGLTLKETLKSEKINFSCVKDITNSIRTEKAVLQPL